MKINKLDQDTLNNFINIPMENTFIASISDNMNGCCPRIEVTLNDTYQVNALMNDGSVPSLTLLGSNWDAHSIIKGSRFCWR